jgi:hypothetical protein
MVHSFENALLFYKYDVFVLFFVCIVVLFYK